MVSKAWILAVALLLGACAARTIEAEAGPAPLTVQFRRGVNVLGYDPYWMGLPDARFQMRHFAEIRRGGFDFVRINLFAFRHMDESNRLDPAWLERLDRVVSEARKAGLGVILDEHDFDACSKDVPMQEARLFRPSRRSSASALQRLELRRAISRGPFRRARLLQPRSGAMAETAVSRIGWLCRP